MPDETTARLALPLLQAGQAQKEITHNEALTRIDMALSPLVESADIAAPPGAPVAGQCWIVAGGASGLWLGQAGRIAGWTTGGWRFVAPTDGMTAQVRDRGRAMQFDGTAWRDAAVRPDGVYLGGVQVVGTRGAAIGNPSGGSVTDAESRAAIGSILTMLRGHGLIA